MTPDGPRTVAEGFDRFDPGRYLHEYYSAVGSENRALLSFLVRAFAEIGAARSMVELGVGPTIYQLVAAAPRVERIDVADALVDNLQAVEAWVQDAPGAFDWSAFIDATLELEGHADPRGARDARADLLRSRIGRRLLCDAHAPDPLHGQGGRYDVVGSHFVVESITGDPDVWRRGLANLCGLVGPGGWLVTSSLEGARFWRVGGDRFPAVALGPADLSAALLEEGLEVVLLERVDAEITDVEAPGYEGYAGLMFAAARRP